DQQPTLYLVPTPIGNLDDMTFRAVKILQTVDFIAAEDTRVTKKLCNHFDITTPLVSLHEHNEWQKREWIVEQLHLGKHIALVSDAGMPCISDPGVQLVEAVLAHNLPVVPLPGANAALTALIASGLTPQPFYFYGFLAHKKSEKKKQIAQLADLTDTIVFYESPHRIKETLQFMLEGFGDRRVVLARELTKKFEEFLRGSISEVLEVCEGLKGEMVVIVEAGEGREADTWWETVNVAQHVEHYIEQGMMTKEAIKQAAVDRQVPKKIIYSEYHGL
ncbi:MAG: 16S rRNA (cytidine(1402)-2'-O)-methyltransferase, partial [Culicoidibacterales bacterium]